MSDIPRLLLVTDRTQTGDRHLVDIVVACVAAGFRHVLLRERDLASPMYDDLLACLRDRIDHTAAILTRTARADGAGCHLSRDVPWPKLRPAIVGRSVHDAAELRRAAADGADFVIAGPYAPTSSKPGHGPALGIDGLRNLAATEGCPPVLAIGGVRPGDLGELAAAGIHGAAVMGPLMRAADPHRAALEYVGAATVLAGEMTS